MKKTVTLEVPRGFTAEGVRGILERARVEKEIRDWQSGQRESADALLHGLGMVYTLVYDALISGWDDDISPYLEQAVDWLDAIIEQGA